MEIKQATPETNPNTGRSEILVTIDQNDVKIIEEALLVVEQENKFDVDDMDYRNKFNHVKDINHQIRNMLWPS